MTDRKPVSLAGGKALIAGIADDQSIARGCAKALRLLDADVAVSTEDAAIHGPVCEEEKNYRRTP